MGKIALVTICESIILLTVISGIIILKKINAERKVILFLAIIAILHTVLSVVFILYG